MAFKNEKDFEQHLRQLIKKNIVDKYDDIWLLDNKKAVDILICRNGKEPALFFIEVKYHQKSHGRLGFGSASGVGFQPEIVKKGPAYFEKNLRWIIANEDIDQNGMIFCGSDTIRKFLSGGEVSNKFNNIQNRIFSEVKGLQENELAQALEKWVTT